MSQATGPSQPQLVDKLKIASPPKRAGLEPPFLPRSVAVIGATDRPGAVGRSVVSNLMESKSSSKIYVVNPAHGEVLGLQTQKHIGDIDGVVLEMTEGLADVK